MAKNDYYNILPDNLNMKRNIINNFISWKNKKSRKPLVLKGARQVGKTWAVREFGKNNYSNFVEINFDKNDEMKALFLTNKDPKRIIDMLCVILNKKLLPENTLLFFDEIQECPEALNTLKYFCEDLSEYHVIAAGSLLGTLLSQPKSYPVGKVEVLNVYPLAFDEFLCAIDEGLYNYYLTIDADSIIPELFHNRLLDIYNYYLIIGGMPECVNSWVNSKDASEVEKIQRDLLLIYENDFSKYNGKLNAARLLLVFRSIASQLAKENEKFIYGTLKSGGRAREFEEAIEWLVSAGLLNKVNNVSTPEHPLPAFELFGCFKLFMFDTGLLKFLSGVDNKSILLKSDFRFKGQLAENFILQQLKEKFYVPLYYYSWKNGELDFLLQYDSEVIPIEVKAGEDKSAASFKNFIKNKQPKYAIRFSKKPYMKNGAIINMPLYLAGKLHNFLKI